MFAKRTPRVSGGPNMQMLREGAVGGIAQHHQDSCPRNAVMDIARRRFRPYVSRRSLTDCDLVADAFEEPQIVRPFANHRAESLSQDWLGEVSPQFPLRALGGQAQRRVAVLRAKFGGEKARLLDGAHVDLGMLRQVMIERSCPGFRNAGKKEVGQHGQCLDGSVTNFRERATKNLQVIKHDVHHHSRHADIEPDGQSPAGNGAVAGEVAGARAT